MKSVISCTLVCLFVAVSMTASATNYFVDPSSAGANQGTFTNPWRSIDDIPWAINYFSPGDTVFFKRGQQYTGTLSINSSGSAGAPIVFMPYGTGHAPVFQYNMVNNTEPLVYNRVIIRLNQVNHIVIDGFELTDVTIPETDHHVTANVGYGVYIYKGAGNNGSNNLIKNLTISRLGSGVCIDGGSHNTITDCSIRNLRMILNTPDIMWDDFGAMGIMVGGSDNTITHNQIHDCWSNSYDYQIDGGAIEMYGPVCNNKILYNTASENLGFMEFGSGSGGQALNNLVGYNLLVNNGHVFWINSSHVYSLDVRNLEFFNNNIVETHAPRIADIRNLIGIMSTPSVANVLTMKNNIFWIKTSSNITDPVTQPFNGPQLIHQNNLFHMNGGSLGYTLDATEQHLNPALALFTDISSSGNPLLWDYNLQPTATAINFGQHTGIHKDFFGQAVPLGGAPDAGIAESIAIVLPLKILSCRGWKNAHGNMIEWETTSASADHFDIEKNTGGNNFKTIAKIPHKTTSGAASVIYQFTDNEVTNEIQHYRIKAVVPGNAALYSRIISIKTSASPDQILASPNPARDYVFVKAPGNDLLDKELVLLNMAGMVIKKERLQEAGSQVRLNVSKLSQGAYILKLIDHKTGRSQSTRFTK
ncbi:T9SS type A sorting domain-containing protein [Longitalea arenae]|uniref:T9SS type A sorting domain-containing protein n=1 Tax=Longitalea arenae TaxID=2812558 RepID=UPI001967554A|nr:right-handed parallel beta-helix repeat-containing protein [Longitalea arenae]